jgi:hypothetical protein
MYLTVSKPVICCRFFYTDWIGKMWPAGGALSPVPVWFMFTRSGSNESRGCTGRLFLSLARPLGFGGFAGLNRFCFSVLVNQLVARAGLLLS